MKRFKPVLLAALISIAFIVLTGIISAEYMDSALGKFCFMFHLYPFGIGFSGGNYNEIVIYYTELWLGITIFFLGIIYLINIIRN